MTDLLQHYSCFFPSCSQNVELPLDLVHEQLISKTFLIHIKPVQAQLADARQRYTVIYYYEADHATSSVQVVSETKNDLPLLNDQSPTLELADTGKRTHTLNLILISYSITSCLII